MISVGRKMEMIRTKMPRKLFCTGFILLLYISFGLSENPSDEPYVVEPTPALKLNDEGDLTTVLLVNNENRNGGSNGGSLHGRYLNVKPAVGLLTSTARTFIQEGVTTEYATQVLGTTLDNGRLYAQLLKKSSRVLYDKDVPSATDIVTAINAKNVNNNLIFSESGSGSNNFFPSIITGTNNNNNNNNHNNKNNEPGTGFALESHNDIIAQKDWELIDDRLLGRNTFVRNTDFIAPIDNPKGALLVFPTRASYSLTNDDGYDGSNDRKIEHEKNFYMIINDEQSNQSSNQHEEKLIGIFGNETVSVFTSSSSSSSKGNAGAISGGNDGKKISADKVKPAENLPTYTVKNVFEPSGFSLDTTGGEENSHNERVGDKMKTQTEFRSPKFLYNGNTGNTNNHNNYKLTLDDRMYSTVTYYGFADFTTNVGDTVIVFSPSTAAPAINPGQITSIKGEATLHTAQETVRVSHVPIIVAHDIIEPTVTMQTLTTATDPFMVTPKDIRDKHENEDGDGELISTTEENEAMLYQTTMESDNVNEDEEHTTIANEENQLNNKYVEILLQPSVSEPENIATIADTLTGATETTKLLSIPSNEDVLKIYASIASAEAAKKLSEKHHEGKSQVAPSKSSSEPEIKIFGGATTIFFEDDPFQAFETTKTEDDVVHPTYVPTTENPPERVIKGDRVPVTENPDEEEEKKQQEDDEISSTTVFSGSTESSKDNPISETTEVDKINEENVEKVTEQETTSNLDKETKNVNSTVINTEKCINSTEIVYSQEPQTLTYLTTFFIPDGLETSTSIESNIVTTFDIVSSTKFNCPYDEHAAKTAIKEEIIKPTQVLHENIAASSQSLSSNVLEKPTTKETDENDGKISKGNKAKNDTDQEENIEASTTPPLMIITEKSHITEATTNDESISSPPATNTEENSENEEAGEEEEDDENEDEESDTDEENQQSSDEEIELIYKTLYTTYTYLTTFFHDSTTSISSRKEVVTNVITSTISPLASIGKGNSDNILSSSSSVPINGEDIEPTATLLPANIIEGQATKLAIGTPTPKFIVPKSDLVEIDDILRENTNRETTAREELNNKNISDGAVKTYYTTYTYYTTIFDNSETEILSHSEVYTNYITDGVPNPTISPTALMNDVNLSSGTIISEEDNVVLDITPTATYETIHRSTSSLSSSSSSSDNSKVVHNNNNNSTNSNNNNENNKSDYDIRSSSSLPELSLSSSSSSASSSSSSTIIVDGNQNSNLNNKNDSNALLHYSTVIRDNIKKDQDQPTAVTTTVRIADESSVSSGNTEIVAMITDVKSSSSDGDRHIIENINKQSNVLLEDQVSSESNVEDILPSPTLLLQTSYTTFTYYTTMYSGTGTNIVSRFETVTNVVTETLQPTQTVNLDDMTVPITYFTTFTYWTTLVKDGDIVTVSREETVSNVITPTAVAVGASPVATSTLPSIQTETVNPAIDGIGILLSVASASSSATLSSQLSENSGNSIIDKINQEKILPSETTSTSIAIEPTTFYTTYTYYTTSYAGDSTIINSRFETVTNVVTPVPEIVPTIAANTDEGNDRDTQAKVEPVFIPPTSVSNQENANSKLDGNKPSEKVDYVSINKGKIVDAEGISTIFYTTKAVPSTINGEYTEVIESTSSISIDEIKKAFASSSAASTATPELPDQTTKSYKVGLVRLIEGTMIANRTTTLYESKVIGTIIDGRYAQIIQSTSSFLIEKTVDPTGTQSNGIGATTQAAHFTPTPSSNAVESSISEGKEETESNTEKSDDENDTGTDENGRPKSRLTFSTRKKTFTPVIRPFASRNRPQFAPKRKDVLPSSATIITRSDFTPTITATPAIKADSTRGRFSSARRGGSVGLSSSGVSGTRRFSRPRSSASGSSSGGAPPSSAFPGSTRNRLSSSRIQPTSSYFGLSSRRGGGVLPRGGAGGSSSRFSSIYAGNTRLRIKPTTTTSLNAGTSTSLYTTQENYTEEDTVTESADEVSNTEEEETDVTTENSRRRENPLLRFRRPPLVGKSPATTSSGKIGQVSPRRNPLTQRTKGPTTTTMTSTTPKPKPRAIQRLPGIATLQNRPRPQNSLFPPRGILRQPANQDLKDDEKKSENENEFNDDLEAENNEYEDEDGEEDEEEEGDENQRKRRAPKDGNHSSSHKAVRHTRNKRQADYGTRNLRSRFRRPTTARSIVAEDRIDPIIEEEPVTVRTRTTGRYSGRSNHKSTSSARIRPAKPTTRAQFTLREKDTATKSSRSNNFRRPTSSGLTVSRRTTAATISRPKAPRLKTYTNPVTEASYAARSTSGRSRQATRGRSTTRSRGRTTDYQANDEIALNYDGTITVTHHIPTEITIPVVNGKVTEYKNVVTAKVSTEVVGPNEYNTIAGRNGIPILILNREETMVNNNGATEITQFVLHQTPTTSIIFTPTTIRGRRTSFSHIIPSTVYEVENVVSTIQPEIAANAPLANILLSKLLLGNAGIQQENVNPLLGLGFPGAIIPTPTTEYKTRTTTYVTEVTNAMSTVIPLTFRGKEILTTIVDSSVSVITATEFLTDTIVIAPTMPAVQQVNSLLLPLLLQQQLQAQQNPLLPIQNTVLPTVPEQSSQQLLFPDNFQELDTNRIHKVNLDEFRDVRESEEFPEQESFLQQEQIPLQSRLQQQQLQQQQQQPSQTPPTTHRKRHRKGHKQQQMNSNQQQKQQQPAVTPNGLETSVITLYVSGRRPGEFSTVLSTVVGTAESTLHKREVDEVHPTPVEKSATIDIEDVYTADESEIREFLLPAANEISSSQQIATETQSLESIVGNVSLWYLKTSSISPNSINPTEKFQIESNKISSAVNNSDNDKKFNENHNNNNKNNNSKHFLK